MKTLISFKDFKELYPTEESVIVHYIEVRYKNKVTCHHCGSGKVYQYHERPKFFQCNDCHNTFSIFKGTIFQKTKTALIDWYYVIHLLLNGKKGISAYQVQRMMGGTYKRSWRMLRQIRIAFRNQEVFSGAGGVFEADEVYCNGGLRKENVHDKDKFDEAVKAPDDKPTKRILSKIASISSKKFKKRKTKKGKRGRGTNKIGLLGIINRKTKQVYVKVMPFDDKGNRLSADQVNAVFKTAMQCRHKTVITDEYDCYTKLHELGIRRIIITHKIAYSKKGVNTNTIESFWSIIQRMIIGVYHHVSPEKLQSYVDECVFRFNNRQGKIFFKPQMFEKFIAQTILA